MIEIENCFIQLSISTFDVNDLSPYTAMQVSYIY